MKIARIHGQPSWIFASNKVEAAVTQLGGHLAPVKFRLKHGVVQPYAIAPWAEEVLDRKIAPLFHALRGDFFCAPFGGNETPYNGERHLIHGETAQARWKLKSLTRSRAQTRLHLSLKTKTRPGRVDKFLFLRRDETALYCRHALTGMSGKMSLGHHATLKFPAKAGSGLIDTSPISHGQVLPVPFENPAGRGYSFLKVGAPFVHLDKVPASDGTQADLSRYPARPGFDDLAMVTHQAAPDFAWTAVAFPEERYVWFALKDPRVLRSTILWMSHGGRHYPPWNGRHVNVMALEDVTAYFHIGLAESARKNPINRRGIATSLLLDSRRPLIVNYIMGVTEIPAKWGRVKSIICVPGGIQINSPRGRPVHVPLDPAFLYSNHL